MLKKFKYERGDCWIDVSKISSIQKRVFNEQSFVGVVVDGIEYPNIYYKNGYLKEFDHIGSSSDKEVMLNADADRWIEENLLEIVKIVEDVNLREYSESSLSKYPLCTRTLNCLQKEGIDTMKEFLCSYSEPFLKRVKGFGYKSMCQARNLFDYVSTSENHELRAMFKEVCVDRTYVSKWGT